MTRDSKSSQRLFGALSADVAGVLEFAEYVETAAERCACPGHRSCSRANCQLWVFGRGCGRRSEPSCTSLRLTLNVRSVELRAQLACQSSWCFRQLRGLVTSNCPAVDVSHTVLLMEVELEPLFLPCSRKAEMFAAGVDSAQDRQVVQNVEASSVVAAHVDNVGVSGEDRPRAMDTVVTF